MIHADFLDIEAESAKNVNQRPAQNKPLQPGAIIMVVPRRKRILLVEDEEDVKDLCEITLAEYDLTCSRDFDEGLRIARQRDFDLYILDSWLPGKSGVELCRAIREFDSDTPILFYSAAAFKRDIQEALREGAQAYLTKPASAQAIRHAVGSLISAPPEMDS